MIHHNPLPLSGRLPAIYHNSLSNSKLLTIHRDRLASDSLAIHHMSTERPKVQGYLLPDIYQRFTDWKKSRGIEKDSEALNRLLGEYFLVNHSNPPTIHPVTEERVREIVGETVDTLAKKSKA